METENITAESRCWQKQETHKGIEPVAGSLAGGWGFHCWVENVNGQDEVVHYSAADANAMAADGSITNHPVFSVVGTPLNNRDATQDGIYRALAEHVPAISSPVGGSPTFDNPDRYFNLNSSAYKDGWGRNGGVYEQNWLHSDMKDMAYFYVWPLYDELLLKGNLK